MNMTLEVSNSIINCTFDENDTTHSTECTYPTFQSASNICSVFFEEQADVVSEIMSFLDAKSLLTVCQTTKTFSSCLRHDHVITSALSTASPLQLTSTSLPMSLEIEPSMFTFEKEKKETHLREDQSDERHHCNRVGIQTREFTIMTRLLQVFDNYNSLQLSKNGDLSIMTMSNIEQPSPMRLLRLVNGKKCERCNRKLSPSSTNIVLPSLTFGKFCCTKCIFT